MLDYDGMLSECEDRIVDAANRGDFDVVGSAIAERVAILETGTKARAAESQAVRGLVAEGADYETAMAMVTETRLPDDPFDAIRSQLADVEVESRLTRVEGAFDWIERTLDRLERRIDGED
ncbi:MAG TPA: hypothetical protein VM262_06355 [Acidimicrobiales bacterium]|nr:hypothetical protein [Acidimicrobiales bacterium]